jgi:hypothetical protein
MRKDQRHLVLSLALAGTVLASAATPVLAAVALPAVQSNGSPFIKWSPASAGAQTNAAFWKWDVT